MLQSQPTPKVFISYSHDSTATEIEQINNAECNSFYNEDSSTSLKEGELAVLQNKNGYYLAVKIERVLYRGRHADDRDELIFSYVIAPAKSISFSRHV